MSLLLDDIKGSVPFLFRRIDTRWVLAASLEKNERFILNRVEVFNESLDVKALGLWVIIPDEVQFETSSGHDFVVERPAYVGSVGFLDSGWHVHSHKLETECKSTSSTDGLHGADTTFLNCRMVRTISEIHGLGSE